MFFPVKVVAQYYQETLRHYSFRHKAKSQSKRLAECFRGWAPEHGCGNLHL